jgi:hypothetical protein
MEGKPIHIIDPGGIVYENWWSSVEEARSRQPVDQLGHNETGGRSSYNFFVLLSINTLSCRL